MARLGAWAALALLTLYLVFFGGGWFGLYVIQLRITSVVLAGIVLGVWAVVAMRRPEWRPRSAIVAAIGACLASLAISTVFSQHPRLSIEYLGYAVILAALYLLLVRILSNPWFRARIATLTVGLFVVTSMAFVALVVKHWLDLWSLVGHVTFPPLRPESESLTLGNPSTVMAICVLLGIPAAVSVGLATPARRAIVGLGALLLSFVVAVSGSRSGWLAIGIAVAATAIAVVLDPSKRATLRALATQVRQSRLAVGLVAAILAVGGLGAILIGPSLVSRLTGGGGENLRIGNWISAIRMFSESPVVGLGPGMWVTNRIRETVAPEADYYIPHAHDLYLQTLAELGVVGAIAGAVLVVNLGWLVIRAARSEDSRRRVWVWAACLSLLYFAAHQLLDIFVNMPAVMFAAALPVAWIDASTSERPRLAQTLAMGIGVRGQQGLLVVGAVIAATSVGGILFAEQPAQRHADAVALANNGEWLAALAPATEAVERDPSWPAYQLTLGLAASHAGLHEEAAAAFSAAAAIDDFPESWVNLAAERAIIGDRAGALDAISRSLRLGYQRTAISAAAGNLALELDSIPTATDALAWAVAVTPSWAADPWWHEDTSRIEIYQSVIDGAIERAIPTRRWEIAAMSGDMDRARKLVDELDASSQPLALDVIDARSGSDTAFRAVLARCDGDPLAGASLVWCARLSALRGDAGEADRYRRWGFITNVGYESQSELRVSDKVLVGRSVEGDVASFYGAYTYRRPTPWDLLVPSLIHFTVK